MVVEDGQRAGDEDGEEDGHSADPAHAWLLDVCRGLVSILISPFYLSEEAYQGALCQAVVPSMDRLRLWVPQPMFSSQRHTSQ